MSFQKVFNKIMKIQNGDNGGFWLSHKHSSNLGDKYQQLLDASEGVYVVKFKSIETSEDLARIINSLKENSIYASKSESFNDIFDTQIQITDEQIAELRIQFPDKNIENEVIRFNNLNNILSLSLINPFQGNSSHMWGLYAKQGNGIAIRYSLKEILKKLYYNSQNDEYFNNTKYQKNEFDNLYELFKSEVSIACVQYSKDYNPKERFKVFIGHPNTALNNSYTEYVTYKHEQWSNEEELRIILNISDKRITDELIANSKEQLKDKIPYLKKCFFPMPSPKEILIGWEIKKEVEDCITSLSLSDTVVYKLTGKMDYSKEETGYEVKELKSN